MRATYTISGQYIDHRYADPWSGTICHVRYWLPARGGYVRMDVPPFARPGTLGDQPHTNGTTWRATDIADLLQQIKADLRRQRRAAAKD